MPTALEQIAACKPAETGGSRASNRLAYQRNWTFSLLLRLHESDDDYLVLCDYHDDVVVLRPSQPPPSVEFFQIKTDAKEKWTVARLLRGRKGKDGTLPSVLGKLYQHQTRFPDDVRSLNLVSTQPFSLDLKTTPGSESRARFTALELTDASIERIRKHIKEELSLPAEPTVDSILVFHVSDLSLADHDTHTQGRLLRFLEARYPGRLLPVPTLYRVLADEIKRKTDEERTFESSAELVKHKGVTREYFEKALSDCLVESTRKDPKRIEQELRDILLSDGVPLIERQRLCHALSRFSIDYLDPKRGDLARLAAKARGFCDQSLPTHAGPLLPLLRTGAARLSKQLAGAFTPEYLEAVIAWAALSWTPPEESAPTAATSSIPEESP